MDQYCGEIRAFPYQNAAINYTNMSDWMLCNGQMLSWNSYGLLASVIGVTYGGIVQEYFNLPNLNGHASGLPRPQGCVVIGAGQGPGLSNYAVGQTVGAQTVTLTEDTMPAHPHTFTTAINSVVQMTNGPIPSGQAGGPSYFSRGFSYDSTAKKLVVAPVFVAPQTDDNLVAMSSSAVGPAYSASPAPHNNMMPYSGMIFCIAVNGLPPFNN